MEIHGITMERMATPTSGGSGSREGPAAKEASASSEPAFELSREQLEKAASDLAVQFGVKVEMAEDEESGRSVVRIMSKDGERILRQMPPEAAIVLAQRAMEGSAESLLDSVV